MLGEFFSHLSFADIFNISVFLVFTLCYAYQLFYIAEVMFRRHRDKFTAKENHKFAVMIAARNEEKVIGNLLDSIAKQDYPSELVDIFVIADNCTDSTADIARKHGAFVFERHNLDFVGKGYALDFGYKMIQQNYGNRGYEAYMVFDADNILDKGYIKAMNVTLDRGAAASTSYRNSKNFETNWISAGYGTWFIREAKFLSQARQDLNTSCAISGTGFFIRADVLDAEGGWKWHLLTEDIEFSIVSAIAGRRIWYTPDAVLYDEQPTKFKDSWTQRERWAKGFYQVFVKYWRSLIKGMFTSDKGKKFACYDMFMTIAPGMLLTIITVIFNLTIVILGLLGIMSADYMVSSSINSVMFCLLNYTAFMFIIGIITMFVEWESFMAPTYKKLIYSFTFPFFMLTYIPIAIVALFKQPQWKPIDHSVDISIESMDTKKAASKEK